MPKKTQPGFEYKHVLLPTSTVRVLSQTAEENGRSFTEEVRRILARHIRESANRDAAGYLTIPLGSTE
jgi:hypothetical protein